MLKLQTPITLGVWLHRICVDLDKLTAFGQRMFMKVVVAEKPSVARELAAVLGVKQQKQGYLEGRELQVTWAFGHLVELQEPHAYQADWRQWRLEDLPLLPDRFQLQPRGDSGAQQQLKVIQALLTKADELICATDAGREGELIFRYLVQWCQAEDKPFQRLWLQSLTTDSIRKGFASLRDGHAFDALFSAARCRSEADWIIGLNATRYTTVKFGSRNQLWSVGRVQTPVLALLAERDVEIEGFTPEPYWVVVTRYRDTRFSQPGKKFNQEEKAQQVVENIREAPLEITDVQEKSKKVPPPQLYDLSSLQQEMNTWFSYTADETLQTAQELYEAKILTYPRTDSRHIGTGEAEALPALLRSLPDSYADYVQQLDLDALRPGKRVVDDSKVTDHHAILPTETPPTRLSGRQEKVYAAVVRRLLAALFPVCEEAVTTVKAVAGETPFQAKGTVIVDPGWRALYPHLLKKKPGKEEEDGQQQMPTFEVGESGPHTPEVLKKSTKPPKRYTEASLLKRMETAGRLVDDEEMRDAMKQRGLGTPATRAAIIETLISRGYIRRQKKQLLSTENGRHLLSLVQDPSLKSAELTGDWEAKLKDIEQGKGEPDTFMAEIREHARQLVHPSNEKGLGPCPTCGAPIIEGKKGFGCSAWKSGCKTVFWKQQPGFVLTEPRIRELLDLGHTLNPVPCQDPEKGPGLVKLTLSQDATLQTTPVKGKPVPKGKKALTDCSLCGGRVFSSDRGYVCSNGKLGCPLFISKVIAKKNITQEMMKELVSTGTTGKLEGFTSRAGKPFSARLILQEGRAVFDFS